jgi:hypothetical protein
MIKGQHVKDGNINARWTLDEHVKHASSMNDIINQLKFLEEVCLRSYGQAHSLTLQCGTTMKKLEKFRTSLDDNFWSEHPKQEISPY